jgi:hypothetical protein
LAFLAAGPSAFSVVEVACDLGVDLVDPAALEAAAIAQDVAKPERK